MTRGDLLDRIDPQRHDVAELVEKLNAFEQLADEEQDAQEGLWLATGLAEAEHPISAFRREGHNTTCVVRDLDGDLQFVFETAPASGRWASGPAYQEHIADFDLEELDDETLAELDIPLTRAEFDALIESLPRAPGPVTSF